jgi:hypothetical protein
MFTHIDWLIHLEHHQDLLRESEQERLARLAVSAHPVRKTEMKEAIDLNNKPKSTSTVAVCCPSGAS